MVEVLQVGLESVNFTLVDVVPGHEAAFNRWYENDHFYAGGVLGPAVLGGRRWYAPQALRSARFAGDPCPFADPTAGTNLATYFFNVPHGGQEFRDWVGPQIAELRRQGRMFAERVALSIAFYTFDGVVDGPGAFALPPHAAADHPFGGLFAVLATGQAEPSAAAAAALPAGALTLVNTWRPEPAIVEQADFLPYQPVRLVLSLLPGEPPGEPAATAELTTTLAAAAGAAPMWGAGFLPVVPGRDDFVTTIR